MTASNAAQKGLLDDVSNTMREQDEKNVSPRNPQELTSLIEPEQYIGDLLNLEYDTADILIHDSHRNRVNGVPYSCLLIASRITPKDLTIQDPGDSRASLLLLRVIGTSRLNSNIDLSKTRFDIVQRANDTENNYDEAEQTDQFTLNLLRYSAMHCRVLGTFYMSYSEQDKTWGLSFASDIDNFFAGQGMKIYKPTGAALNKIVNQRKDSNNKAPSRRIGQLRYSATNKILTQSDPVPFEIVAEDFIGWRTALFGMTRTGKSNTTKTIAAALFELRDNPNGVRVGQLIFDPNGEYANDNPQDQGCLRNLKYKKQEFIDDVHTYGSNPHPYDKDRHITKFNFYGNQEPLTTLPNKEDIDEALHTLYQGKQIINDVLSEENAGYIQAFKNADVTTDIGVNGPGDYIRLRRRFFVYRSILAEAGFVYRGNANINNLFGKDLRELMGASNEMKQYVSHLESGNMNWEIAGNFIKAFAVWVTTREFKQYDLKYATKSKDERNWSDSHLLGLLRFYDNTRGKSIIQKTRVWHDVSSTSDYAEQIVEQMRNGKLVIVDQLLGDPDMNKQAAKRIVQRLFQEQQRAFSQPQIDKNTNEVIKPPPVIIYAEEAHTLLPRSGENDITNIWARIAKEGAKFNIGLVYSTQEPSSIQQNILTNTENWFFAHLNNTDETNQLRKFHDFADFTNATINVSNAGFIRVRTLSSYFTVQVQMDLFNAPSAPNLSLAN